MLPAAFDKYRAEVDAALRSALANHTSPMYDMLRYHLGWINERGEPLPGRAGKALRPTLCLLACEATSGTYTQALPAAAALELVHNFSLIHDDVQDGDRERRHRPTVWAIWGQPQAINAGTAMRVLAGLTAMELVGRGVPLAKQLRILRMLDESCLRLIEGQYLDISYEGRLDVTVARYLEMIDLKTACLIACSLEAGALLGSDDPRVVQAFQAFGRNLGLAFQIRDDVLGIWGDPAKTGKPVGSDIRRRKKTLPIVYAFASADRQTRRDLARIYSRRTVRPEDLAVVLSILEALEARQWAQGMAEAYGARAMAEVDGLEPTPWVRQSLAEVTSFMVERDH